MARTVRYALRARAFVASEQAYLAEHNEAAARRFRTRLSDAEGRILDYPEIGTVARQPGFRRLVVAPYVLTYRFRGGELEIADIRHGRQRTRNEPVTEDSEN